MKLVYVAGKFRGPTAWDVAENVRRAEQAGLRVARAGAMPVIPHANTAHFDGQFNDAFWLEGTLEMLRRCDAIYVINQTDLATSKGTQGEHSEAVLMGIPVFIGAAGLQDLECWLSTGLRSSQISVEA